MWFKKKSVLQSEHHYDTDKSADGTTDMRTTYKSYTNSSSTINSGLPSAADAGNYFYLPALGYYYNSGQLYDVGNGGYSWSSSATPWSSLDAYYLYFFSGNVGVNGYPRNNGFRVGGFE